ncbi:MAG: methyl-accepting chemotaxis protein [Deltaproteobacteria bacterium]|nr:methyl-accepting chemotaxis protein [Deltaproteobacteria bacterium]
MTKNRSYKRRHFFVKKGYQFVFILKFCLIVIAGAVISTGLLFLFSQGTLTSSFRNSSLAIEKTGFAILPSVLYTNIITLILILLATITVVLFISHKIAGPMFRFEKELKEIGQGNLTKSIRLRNKDQITDMATDLNSMTASLHDKVTAIQNDVEQVIEFASKQNASEKIIEELRHLDQSIHKHFKL